MWTHLLYRCKVNRRRNRPTFLNGFILGAVDVGGGGGTINMGKHSNPNDTNIFIVILLVLHMPTLNELREMEITLSRARVACFQFSVSWFTSGRRNIIALHLLSCFNSYARNNEVRRPICTFEMHLCRTLCFKFCRRLRKSFRKATVSLSVHPSDYMEKKQQVLSTIVLMLDVITSFNFLFFPNDGLKK
jgi:hypothetical protein